MLIPTKKLRNGFSMPVLGLGTWSMGGLLERDLANNDKADIQAIQKAIELGITHIDTAESYANGHTETLVGQAIAGTPRNKLFITTKVAKYHLKADDVKRTFEGSLKRLKTDYVDLLLIHAPNEGIPLSETLGVMDDFVDQGVVKNIGVSNFKTARLGEAQKLSRHKIVTNQVYYNLIIREPEISGLLQYCQESDVFLTAYRPTEKGTLNEKGYPILKSLAEKYGKTSTQIVLNWLLSQPSIITIFKARSFKHIEENLGSVGWALTNEDIELLRKDFPGQLSRSERLPLL